MPYTNVTSEGTCVGIPQYNTSDDILLRFIVVCSCISKPGRNVRAQFPMTVLLPAVPLSSPWKGGRMLRNLCSALRICDTQEMTSDARFILPLQHWVLGNTTHFHDVNYFVVHVMTRILSHLWNSVGTAEHASYFILELWELYRHMKQFGIIFCRVRIEYHKVNLDDQYYCGSELDWGWLLLRVPTQ